jgi:hypothetical protein
MLIEAKMIHPWAHGSIRLPVSQTVTGGLLNQAVLGAAGRSPSMATPLQIFQLALQLLQLLPRLAELSGGGELLIVG